MSGSRMEIDFLLLKPTLTRRHDIVPVEVKSIKDCTTTSLDKFREKFAEQLHEPVVLHPKDVKTDKGVLYLPLYMAQLLVVSCYDSPGPLRSQPAFQTSGDESQWVMSSVLS